MSFPRFVAKRRYLLDRGENSTDGSFQSPPVFHVAVLLASLHACPRYRGKKDVHGKTMGARKKPSKTGLLVALRDSRTKVETLLSRQRFVFAIRLSFNAGAPRLSLFLKST